MASRKQFIERRDNVASIIAYVRQVGRATRMQISSALSLSWACVSDLVSLLLEKEVLLESQDRIEQSESRGRTPVFLTLNDSKYFLGVDINDSGVAVSVLGMSGKLLRFKKWEPKEFEGPEELSSCVLLKIEQMLTSNIDCCGIGVAMEGTRSDKGWRYPFVRGYEEYDPAPIINERFGLPVFVRHDPECMLYALNDTMDGDCIVIRSDNGIGVAAMKQGRILDFPLELGNVRIGDVNLRKILRLYLENKEDPQGKRIGKELGRSAGNLAMLLGIEKIFIVGEIIDWFSEIEADFDSALKELGQNLSFEVSSIFDASEGAAKLAMSKYPITKY